MPNNGRGNGGRGGRHGRYRRFVPLAASEWMGNQDPKSGHVAPRVVDKPILNQTRRSPPAQARPQAIVPQWSSIALTQNNHDLLFSLCHTEQKLEKSGYVREELSEDDLKSRLRCLRCAARTKYRPQHSSKAETHEYNTPKLPEDEGIEGDVQTQNLSQSDSLRDKRKQGAEARPVCFYHPGPVFENFWQCCGQHHLKAGCTSEMSHEYSDHKDAAFQQDWLYHHTPTHQSSQYSQMQQPRLAVALDCEMGIAVDGESELIRVTAVDFFTKEKLVDNIVKPKVEMRHLSTRYSGVSWKDIRQAQAQGTCFYGKDAAREALWKYVGPQTIVLAHSGSNDFNSLRWIHPRIVDTLILYQDRRMQEEQARQLAEDMKEAEKLNITVEEVQKRREAEKTAAKLAKAAGAAMMEDLVGVSTPKAAKATKRHPGGLSLKALVKQHANIDIQVGYGHDSLEDALACRELGVRFVRLSPYENIDQANKQIANSFYGTKSNLGRLLKGPNQPAINSELNREVSYDDDLTEFVGDSLRAVMPDDDEIVEGVLERLKVTMARRYVAHEGSDLAARPLRPFSRR